MVPDAVGKPSEDGPDFQEDSQAVSSRQASDRNDFSDQEEVDEEIDDVMVADNWIDLPVGARPNLISVTDWMISDKSWFGDHHMRNICLAACIKTTNRDGIGPRSLRAQMSNVSFAFWATERASGKETSIDFSDLDCSSASSDFVGLDLSRLPPRAYLNREGALNAIRKEIFGLIKNAHTTSGITGPALSIIDLKGGKYAKMHRYKTTLVVRHKSTGAMKARLCLRGDTIEISKSSFTSAPTSDRVFARLLVSCASQLGFQVGSCDVTQAFLQSEWLLGHERYIALAPPCISLNSTQWNGAILTSPPKTIVPIRFALLCKKPLYGSRCAPLRWYFKIASEFK